jgi:RNA polymerase sigma-70 factor, ECF subfamily
LREAPLPNLDKTGSKKNPKNHDLGGELEKFAAALVANKTEARHLVDEAYMRLGPTEGPHRLDDLRRLKRVIHDILIQRRRDLPSEIVWEEVELKWRRDEYSVKLQPILERLETPGEIDGIMSRLPFIYRSALVLHDVDGWTRREIASGQDISVKTVDERLCRARMMMVTGLAAGAERASSFRTNGHHCFEMREKFSTYLDGSLARRDSHVIERHLRRCATCPPLYAAVVALRDALAPAPTAAI